MGVREPPSSQYLNGLISILIFLNIKVILEFMFVVNNSSKIEVDRIEVSAFSLAAHTLLLLSPEVMEGDRFLSVLFWG